MNKLIRLKSWLSVQEAAKHLSTVLAEEVTEADIYQLGMERRLTLSVNLVNRAEAKIGKIVPLSECEKVELPGLIGNGPVTVYPGAVTLNDGTAIKLEAAMRTIDGIWDLPMIGGEFHTVSNRYHLLSGGPEDEMIAIHGSFLLGDDGRIAQLHENAGEDIRQFFNRAGRGPWDPTGNENYHPTDLPHDCMIVVRPDSLAAMLAQLDDSAHAKPSKKLSDRERNSLHRVIGVMLAELTSRTDPSPKSPAPRYKSEAALIATLADLHAHQEGISKSNLESVFAEAKRRLND